MTTSAMDYILGHAPDELRRLELQAGVLEPITKRMLREVGLHDGMSVLDIGTGAGDVALLAAAAVGAAGRVRALDRNGAALAWARSRAAEAGLTWITFEEAAVAPGRDLGAYDLVVGRYVVMHQPDPVSFLRAAASCAKPGGWIGFVEIAQTMQDRFSVPPAAGYDTAMTEILEAFRNANSDLDVGSRMAALFAQAGLPQPELVSECPVGSSSSVIPEWVARTHRAVTCAPGARQPSWTTLADDIRAEAAASHCQLFGPRNVAAWARLSAQGSISR